MVNTILYIDVHPPHNLDIQIDLENAFQVAVDKALSHQYRGEGEFFGTLKTKMMPSDNEKDIIKLDVQNDQDNLICSVEIPGWRCV